MTTLWRLRRREASTFFELVPLVPDPDLRDWRELDARILLASTFGAERMLPVGSKLIHRTGHLGEADFAELWGPAGQEVAA